MNVHEVFSPEMTSHLESEKDIEQYDTMMFQMAWFEYLCNKKYSEEEVDALMRRLAAREESEERKKTMLSGTSEEKRNIAMQEMIDPQNTTEGSIERRWFREEFLDFKRFPEHKDIVRKFRDHPEEALDELDTLFHESLVKH